MKSCGKQFWLVLAAMVLFIAAGKNHAQQMPAARSTAFSSDMYYETPYEEKVKYRLSGAEALPLPGGLLDVKNFQVEALTTNGVTQMVAQAPRCTIALADSQADSAGHLKVHSGDGKYLLEGDGFLIVWRENAMSLTISNRVHTVIEGGPLGKTGL